jgi:TPR repeat protein
VTARARGRLGRVLAGALSLALLGGAGDSFDVARGLADFRDGKFAEAFTDWWHADAAGDPRGALYLGVLYDSGQGVAQDYRGAMAWYRRAAALGSATGAFNVAVLYDAGLGVPRDRAQAAEWYRRAASRHFGRAEYDLALLYEIGAGVTPNRRDAIALFRRAAGDGVVAARSHLAAMGQHVAFTGPTPQDSALQEFQQAQRVLVDRGAADAAQAAILFGRAADARNPLAEYDLGYCYEHGLGVLPDPARAYGLYRRAAADAANPALRSIAQSGADALGRRIGQGAAAGPSGAP